MYIGIAGNIGSGKSALAQLLTEEFDCVMFQEDDERNPYLAGFYADMGRWAFNLQVSFLSKRFKAVQKAMWSDRMLVQDRTIYEDAYVFVENLLHMGILSHDDYDTYRELFAVMGAFIHPPELLIYLKASVPSLLEHIHRRGVRYEASISPEYLSLLNARYDAWVDSYNHNKLVINVDDVDFVGNDKHRRSIVESIQRQLPGLKARKV